MCLCPFQIFAPLSSSKIYLHVSLLNMDRYSRTYDFDISIIRKREERKIWILQDNYIEKLIRRFNLNIGNIIHWASSKCRRVTRSVLASEIYGLSTGFDQGFTLASTVRMVTDRLHMPPIPIVVWTDSYSLYECIVKLGTTKEKRLMIDLTALRQSYERREIHEIRWIHGDDNPADAFTKTNPNSALR